jgi:hypothetical protein
MFASMVEDFLVAALFRALGRQALPLRSGKAGKIPGLGQSWMFLAQLMLQGPEARLKQPIAGYSTLP